MLELEEFKKHLPKDHNLSEEQILKLRETMDKLADVIFNMWLKKIKNKAELPRLKI